MKTMSRRSALASLAALPVDLVEPTGPDTYVTLDVAGRPVTARVRPHFRAAHGERLSFDVNRSRINLFDAVTERRLA